MKLRIALWATVGALVVASWALYMVLTKPTPHAMWILLDLTCPIALLGHFHHYRLSYYFVLVVNAATYALVGAIVELTLRHSRHARLIPG